MTSPRSYHQKYAVEVNFSANWARFRENAYLRTCSGRRTRVAPMEHNRERSAPGPAPHGPDPEKTVVKLLKPEDNTRPASNYGQCVDVPANARRLIIAGQIGVDTDGSIVERLDAQMRRCWNHIFAILAATYLVNKALAHPGPLVEIEGEAVSSERECCLKSRNCGSCSL